MKKKFFLETFFLFLCVFQIIGASQLYAANAESIIDGKYYTINRFGDKNAFIRQNSSGALATGAYTVSDMCFWQLVATDNPDCFYIKNASSGLYMQSSKAGNSTVILLGKEPVEYKIAKDMNTGVSTSGYYYLCSTDQTVDNTKSGTKGLNYSSGNHTVVSYDIVSGTNANSYWEICLMDEGVTPPVLPNDDPFVGDPKKYYTFSSCTSSDALIAENNAGELTTSKFHINTKVFWKLIPTNNPDCYYIQNAVSGRYIQSSKQSLSSRIPMGDNPVEFKIGKDLTDGAGTYGYFYLCSTDQTNIPAGAIGLNYDAFNTKNIVAWYAKTGDKNSYWAINEVEYTYEPKLVPSVESIDDLGSIEWITLKTTDSKYLAANGNTLIKEAVKNSYHTAWAFVGTTNLREGYLMLNYNVPGKALSIKQDGSYEFVDYDAAVRWFVEAQEDGALKFIPYDVRDEKKQYIQVGENTVFTLDDYRTPYALATQIYTLPCGTATGTYLSRFMISGDDVLRGINYQATQKPQSYYTMYTQEKPIVAQGKTFLLQTSLAGSNSTDSQIWVYFDWDRDGVFEKSYQANESVVNVDVPAEAKLGKSRIRVRVTDNALTDAEDDVTGALYDFILYVDTARVTRNIQVRENGKNRGTAYIISSENNLKELDAETGTEVIVRAEALSGIDFLCWMNGKKVVTTEPEYAFMVSEDMDLTACFSPSDSFTTNVENIPYYSEKFIYEITEDQGILRVQTDADVKAVLIYAANGTLMQKSSQKNVSLKGLSAGTYIIKVITAQGNGSQKILLD